jgi:hypothetical protein
MNINLVLATGLAYTVIGAMIMFLSHRALYLRATSIVAGYPKVLAALRAQRSDARFGLIVLLCGNALQVLAACGYTVSAAHWRVPTCAVVAILVLYGLWRLLSTRPADTRTASKPLPARTPVRRVYETRRSMILLAAARQEAANRRARELAKGLCDRSVIYVGQDLECRWWSDRFGVSSDALKDAVREVGPMVQDIERHFASKHRPRAGFALAA